jgi:hypothetical protein
VPSFPVAEVAGWTVAGRHGRLGEVVEPGASDFAVDETQLVVRGGTSQALFFHIPVELVTNVARSRCWIRVDADVADFAPHLRTDGSVDLYPRPS